MVGSLNRVALQLLFTSVLLVAGCGDVSREGGTERGRLEVTDSAGVTILRSLSGDQGLLLDAEPLLTLGGRETPEESFYVVDSWNVGTADETVYVLDRDAYRVQVFDGTGRHLRTLGGQGGGPGEFQFPFGLAVGDDGRLWVVDVGKRALVQWGPDGLPGQEEPFPEGYFGGHVRWTTSGMVFPLRDMSGHRLVLLQEAGDEVVLASIPLAETRALQLASCGMSFGGMEPIFSPSLVWAASRNTVVVARNPDYVLDVYQDGQLVRRLERDVFRRPASAELARASLGDGMRVGIEGGERICDPAEVVEQQGFAPYLPMVGRIALAPDGTLWVERYAVEPEATLIDIFEPEGRYMGTLQEGSPFPIGFFQDGRILTVQTDELGVQRLVVRTAELASEGM